MPANNPPGVDYGLGVGIFRINGRQVYGHDGATLGGTAFMGYFPDADAAIALQQNFRDNLGNANYLFETALETAGLSTSSNKTSLPVGFLEWK